MRLLVVTQVVDRNDPVLGFFHRWLGEFAKQCERIHVICLKEGEHALPENVIVHSLGKEDGVSRVKYVTRFFRYIWKYRSEYDAVFVHMNQEYVLLGGWLWRLLGKRVTLWYTHGTVNIRLRIATLIVHRIFTASPESFRVPTRKVDVVGHGIDTHVFKPDARIPRGEHWLSVGRLMKTKRHDLIVRAAALANAELRIVGDGFERAYLESLANEQGAEVVFVGALPPRDLVREYQSAHVLIHASETGSLDKVVLEALACGTPVVSTNASLDKLPITISDATPEAIANAASAQPLLVFSVYDEYVRLHHALPQLIRRLCDALQEEAV